LRGSVGTGTKEDESSTGRVWAAGFHRVRVHSGLARVFKRMNRFISLIFQIFFPDRGYGGPPVFFFFYLCERELQIYSSAVFITLNSVVQYRVVNVVYTAAGFLTLVEE